MNTKENNTCNEKRTSVCTLCGRSGCGVEVTLNNNEIINVEGNKNHPESHGFICAKGKAVKNMLYSPERLKTPLKRVGEKGEGKWEKISWDEAYQIISEKLLETKQMYGPESVVFHKGSGHDVCAGEVGRNYLHRLANVFGSPNLTSLYNVCYGPRIVNLLHTVGAIFAPDFQNSRCALVWGLNSIASAPYRYQRLLKAKKKGMKIIHVDPRRTPLSEKSDIHLQLRPGTDGALALGMLHVIISKKLYDAEFVKKWTTGFEELEQLIKDYPPEKVEKITGVPKDMIREAALLYGGSKPASILTGNGLDQHTNNSQAIRSIYILMAISGNIDIPGGNVLLIPTSLAKNSIPAFELLPKEIEKKRLGQELLITQSEYTRFAHPNIAVDAMLTEKPYPVKAMMVIASNMLLTMPNYKRMKQALKKLDFMVVADLFMTETAQMADIVLPACTYLEQTYYVSYEAGTDFKPENPALLMLRPQIIPPLYESKSDWQIIIELAKKMGYEETFPWDSIEEAIDYELKPTGITYQDLLNHPEGIQIKGFPFLYKIFGKKGIFGRIMIRLLNSTVFRKYPEMYRKYKMMGFVTPSKKVEIASLTFQQEGLDKLPIYHEPAESPLESPEISKDYPLVLTTGAKVTPYVHSQYRNIPELRKLMPESLVEIHPDTTKSLNLADGEMARIETRQGFIECRTRVTDKIRPDTVLVYFGFNDSNANLLIDDQVWDPVTGSSPMRSSLCRVERVV